MTEQEKNKKPEEKTSQLDKIVTKDDKKSDKKESKKKSGKTKIDTEFCHAVIKHAVNTEKVIRLMETENKLVFVVSKDATRSLVKKAIEDLFNVKVMKVNLYHSPKGDKRAYVRFDKSTPASNIATELGLLM